MFIVKFYLSTHFVKLNPLVIVRLNPLVINDSIFWTFLQSNEFPSSFHTIQSSSKKFFTTMRVRTSFSYWSLRLSVNLCPYFSYVLHPYHFFPLIVSESSGEYDTPFTFDLWQIWNDHWNISDHATGDDIQI